MATVDIDQNGELTRSEFQQALDPNKDGTIAKIELEEFVRQLPAIAKLKDNSDISPRQTIISILRLDSSNSFNDAVGWLNPRGTDAPIKLIER